MKSTITKSTTYANPYLRKELKENMIIIDVTMEAVIIVDVTDV